MTVIFDGVDLKLEVSFQASATGAAWSDITPYVRSVSWGRGRQRELEQAEPGWLNVELLNSDRRFDTFYSGGAYYPYVTPMRDVRLTAIYDSITYELWRGHVDDWSQTWDLPQFSICQMSATDDMQLLARRSLSDAYLYEVLADDPVVLLRLGETEGSFVRDEVSGTLGEFAGTIAGADPLIVGASDGSITFDGATTRVKHVSCGRVTSLPISVEAWFRTEASDLQMIARQGSSNENDGWYLYLYAGAILAGTPMSGSTVQLISTGATFNDGELHHIVYVRDGSTHKFYVDAVDQPTTTQTVESKAYEGLLVGGSFKADEWFTGTLDEVAVYDQALSWAQILTHYGAGLACWAGDTTGVRFARLCVLLGVSAVADDGNTVLGGALNLPALSALEQLQLLAATEGGAMWLDGGGDLRFRERHAPITSAVECTLGNNGGEIGFRTVGLAPAGELLRNEVTVAREGGVGQTVSDLTSQTNYLVQGYDRSGMLYAGDEDSLYAAQWILGRYKDPTNRIEQVEVSPRSDPTLAFPELLALDVAHKVAVNVRPTVGSVISQTSIVEGFSHSVSMDSWVTSLALSPAETRAYLVVGSSTLGKFGTGRFGF